MSCTPPSLAGFTAWIRLNMGISTVYLPDDSPSIVWAYNVALEIVGPGVNGAAGGLGFVGLVSPLIYMLALYNLGGDNLVNYAPDQEGQTYFATLRKDMNITGFVAGVVQSAGDQGTNSSYAVPESLKQLTISNLQNLKTPWGRTYLQIQQRTGTIWGLS